MNSQNLKKTTLAYLIKGDQILLAMKKRGLGQGKFNGFGGKVKEKEGETIEEALVRETMEEIGVKPLNYAQKATLKFFASDHKDWNQEVHVFLIYKWEGEPQESDEMKPQWIPMNAIPYPRMWSDDPYWLPEVLAGKNVQGEFSFNSEGEIISHSVNYPTTKKGEV